METFQGILLSRIICRTCGRHSEKPDRFYDLSVPLLAASPPRPSSKAKTQETTITASAAAAAASDAVAAAGAAAGAAGRSDSYYGVYGNTSRQSRDPSMSPVLTEQPTSASPQGHNHYGQQHSDHPDLDHPSDGGGGVDSRSESRLTSGRCGTEAGDWSWRKSTGGWCAAAEDRERAGDGRADGEGGTDREGTRSASARGGGGSPGYRWVSSIGVWLGIKSVAVEVS